MPAASAPGRTRTCDLRTFLVRRSAILSYGGNMDKYTLAGVVIGFTIGAAFAAALLTVVVAGLYLAAIAI